MGGTGPELGATEPSEPSRPAPTLEDRLEALERDQQTIIRLVAFATLLILAVLAYMRCSDPYWRCRRILADDVFRGGEEETWQELDCDAWPGIYSRG